MHGGGRSGELGGLVLREFDLHDFLDALAADDGRHADTDVALAVFAVQIARAGNQFLLVVENSLHHHRSRGARSIPGRGADELGEGRAAHHRGLHGFGELLLRGELGDGHTIDRGLGEQRNHRRVAMTADDHAVDVVDISAGGLGQGALEATSKDLSFLFISEVLKNSGSVCSEIP